MQIPQWHCDAHRNLSPTIRSTKHYKHKQITINSGKFPLLFKLRNSIVLFVFVMLQRISAKIVNNNKVPKILYTNCKKCVKTIGVMSFYYLHTSFMHVPFAPAWHVYARWSDGLMADRQRKDEEKYSDRLLLSSRLYMWMHFVHFDMSQTTKIRPYPILLSLFFRPSSLFQNKWILQFELSTYCP